MVAYACRPTDGSEPGMGWNRAVQSARQFDTWILCEAGRSEPAIRAYLQQHGEIPGLHFVFVPRPRWQRCLAGIPGMFYLAYNLWHRAALKVAERLHEQLQFDLAHQVTYCGYREPGYTWQLPIPFVWGPIGGTHNFPWRFLADAGIAGAIYEGSRSLFNSLQFLLSSRVRTAARRAALALAGNSATQRHFRESFGIELPLHPASGISDSLGTPRRFRAGDKLRLLWCGHIHPLKGLPLLLKALAKMPADVPYELRIVGKGLYRRSWERLAQRLGIGQHIQWTGWIPHHEALQQYRWADLFVFTSLRDTFPTAVLEALSQGLPVVCFDHLGMGDIVNERCGKKIPLTTPAAAVNALREAIVAATSDSAGWERLSRGAIERASEYTWSQQGKQLARYYRQVLGSGEDEASPALEAACAAAAREDA
jgi:glycosyltransferase involved in cell wall biosynthesis